MVGRTSLGSPLSTRAKLVIVIRVMASAGFIVAAVVTFIQEGDWPAKYLSAAAMILLVLVIGLKRRRRQLTE